MTNILLHLATLLLFVNCYQLHDNIKLKSDVRFLEDEREVSKFDIIRIAAERNGLIYRTDNWFILLAIYKAENGRAGCEFGVKHPRA